MTSRVDFTSQDYFRNPAAALERLRNEGPVVEVNFPIVGRVWTTTTQAMADRVLKDTGTFTIRKEDGEVAGLRWWMPGIIKTFATNMLSMDEPDHKRLRDIVDEAFRRRAVLGEVGADQLQGLAQDEAAVLLVLDGAGRVAGRVFPLAFQGRLDAGPPQVQALKAGTIDALVAQYPYGIGTMGVDLALQYLTKGKAGIKPHYGTGSAIITRANVNDPAMKKYLYTP